MFMGAASAGLASSIANPSASPDPGINLIRQSPHQVGRLVSGTLVNQGVIRLFWKIDPIQGPKAARDPNDRATRHGVNVHDVRVGPYLPGTHRLARKKLHHQSKNPEEELN
jgi:hypothetical protein